MNKRINDLMNQAMPSIDWKARHGVELNNGERNKWYAEWFEKFAELIVLECARIATATPCPYEDEYNRIIFGHTWDMASIEAGREIVRHFGI